MQISSIFEELYACDTSILPFQDNNLRKSQQIFTQLDIRFDIVEIWFGIAIGYLSSFLIGLTPHDMIMTYYQFMFLLRI